MNVDFESRLWADLASVPLDIPVDADATLAAGRRARARRLRAGIGGLVAVLAVVGVVARWRCARPSPPSPNR